MRKREAGRKRAEELSERVLSSVRRNSTQSISLAEFNDRIKKAGEANRAKNSPELEDERTDSEEETQADVLADLPHLDIGRYHASPKLGPQIDNHKVCALGIVLRRGFFNQFRGLKNESIRGFTGFLLTWAKPLSKASARGWFCARGANG